MSKSFELISDFKAKGDQPEAIASLTKGLEDKLHDQVLLGVTGSGKTFSMAHVIANCNRPTVIMAQNKTLAAQLYGEMQAFFPNNAVEYFVSYYDYYQPEAYVPRSDTYIEKESSINEQIDRLRHSATRSLIERRDVVIVASVSCIYGIGSPESYSRMIVRLEKGMRIAPQELTRSLSELQYSYSKYDLVRGNFRLNGDVLEVFPSHLQDEAWRVSFFDEEIEEITSFNPLTGEKIKSFEEIALYPNSHYVTPRPTLARAIKEIKKELAQQLEVFRSQGKLIEAQRLEERTFFDLEMIEASGSCPGIENYSRYLTGREAGMPPPTLFEYLPKDALLIVDESHVSIPQIGGMYRGDRVRKDTLHNYGFRLPSCLDNRPLMFEEWEKIRPDTIYVSATPSDWELEKTKGVVVEQIIRPTGLIDPPIVIEPVSKQVEDVIERSKATIKQGNRVLITTLTKRMAEDLTDYLLERGLKARYLHSDINTIERISLLIDLRHGVYDVLVGINLLREGLDIPECALVAVLDADKEGFLRSRTSLIQTCGRAARNLDGLVVLYADKKTKSIEAAIAEGERRRKKQILHNKVNNITPTSIKSAVRNVLESVYDKTGKSSDTKSTDNSKLKDLTIKDLCTIMHKKMLHYATDLDFERAALLRDELSRLELLDEGLPAIAAPLTSEALKASLGDKEDMPNIKESARALAKARAKKIAKSRAKHAAKFRANIK